MRWYALCSVFCCKLQAWHFQQCVLYVQTPNGIAVNVQAYLSGDQHAGGQEGPASGAYIFRWV